MEQATAAQHASEENERQRLLEDFTVEWGCLLPTTIDGDTTEERAAEVARLCQDLLDERDDLEAALADFRSDGDRPMSATDDAVAARDLIADYLTFVDEQCDVMDRAYAALQEGYEVELTARDDEALVWLEVRRDGKLVVSYQYDRYFGVLVWTVEGRAAKNRALAEEIADVLFEAGLPVLGRTPIDPEAS